MSLLSRGCSGKALGEQGLSAEVPRPQVGVLPDLLVVDDEPSVCAFLAALFRDEGFEVRVAAHGIQALAMVGAHMPDVVISDVMMPVMGGSELCRRLKGEATTAAIPVILMSAGGPLTTDLAAADGFIRKPFELVDLEALVRQCLPRLP